MYVYCGVRLDERNVRWVYDYNGDVRDLSRWKFVRWCRGPTRRLHLLVWVLCTCWCCHDMCGHNCVVCDVYRWKLVRR